MTIEALRDQLPDFAKDIRLNISSVLKEDAASGLKLNQIHGIALASAYATKHAGVIAAFEAETAAVLSEAEINAARGAATVMAMNNVYYRFVHLVSDQDYSKLPAGLRMNMIGAPGIEKVDFELYSLAVSAMNGCGMCMDAHVAQAEKHGITKQGVQQTIKIGAVVAALAQALVIAKL